MPLFSVLVAFFPDLFFIRKSESMPPIKAKRENLM